MEARAGRAAGARREKIARANAFPVVEEERAGVKRVLERLGSVGTLGQRLELVEEVSTLGTKPSYGWLLKPVIQPVENSLRTKSSSYEVAGAAEALGEAARESGRDPADTLRHVASIGPGYRLA